MSKTFLEKLLDFYQISYEEYLLKTKDIDLASFASGHQFNDIDKAVNLVKEVIAHKGKIIVYGDYDCDGVMGTSILVKMFEYLDVVVDYYLPNRFEDGYGLNEKHAQEYIKAGYELIITVDNGISCFEPIRLLKEAGIKVLILDHHQVQDDVPCADAICHPTYSKFGETASSGAFTAFVFSIALLGRTDKYLATLAAISLISDMMPLFEYNRDLLRSVFKIYKPGEFLAIDLLADHEALDENIIGMKIAPRINSIGRLAEDSSINEIVKYFITNDKDFVLSYFAHILDMNEIRKNLSKENSDFAGLDASEGALVIKGEYKEGIIGLIANTLVNKYHVPVVVFTKASDGSYKGSARAPEGFNIVGAFTTLSEYLITFGGHALAGGCSVSEENYETFKNEFIALIKATPFEYVEHPCIDVIFSEINSENLDLINSFAPFGEGWPSPTLRLKRIKTSALTFSKDEKHIITSLGQSLRLVGFGFPKADVLDNPYIDVKGMMKYSYYRGLVSIEFNIKEISPSKN